MSKEKPYYWSDGLQCCGSGEYRGVRWALLSGDMYSPDAPSYVTTHLQSLMHSDRFIENVVDVACETGKDVGENEYLDYAFAIIDRLNDEPGYMESFREEVIAIKKKMKEDEYIPNLNDSDPDEEIPF